jgi:hypothetical protein
MAIRSLMGNAKGDWKMSNQKNGKVDRTCTCGCNANAGCRCNPCTCKNCTCQ